MIDRDLPQHPRGLESPEGHPEGVLHLRVGRNCGTLCQREYKWPDDDGRQHRRPRVEVVEDAEALGSGQIDANFFHRFADRGRQEISVGGFAPAAGEGDLARPSVTGAHGAVDEQRLQPLIAIVQRDRHGCRNHARLQTDLRGVIVPQSPPCSRDVYAETSSPPSTLITLPVIQSAPGCDRATMAPPRSAGVVSRWCGFRCVAISTSFSLPGILRSAGVSVTPPRSAFTAIPSGASSSASCRVWDSSAAFAAETAPYVAKTRVEPDDVIEKIRPPFPISPCFTTPWAQ